MLELSTSSLRCYLSLLWTIPILGKSWYWTLIIRVPNLHLMSRGVSEPLQLNRRTLFYPLSLRKLAFLSLWEMCVVCVCECISQTWIWLILEKTNCRHITILFSIFIYSVTFLVVLLLSTNHLLWKKNARECLGHLAAHTVLEIL